MTVFSAYTTAFAPLVLLHTHCNLSNKNTMVAVEECDIFHLPLTCVSYSAIISLSFRNLAGDVILIKSCHSEKHRRTIASSPALRLQISSEYVGMESSGWVLSPADDQSRRIISWSCRWLPRLNMTVTTGEEMKPKRRVSSHRSLTQDPRDQT